MANAQLESQVINHLEFLGYEVTRELDTETDEIIRLRAEHSGRTSINIRILEGVVAFAIWFGLNDFGRANKQDVLEVVNELNSRFETQFYIGGEGKTDFLQNLVYRGPYEKRAFAQFVSAWEMEAQALYGTEMTKFLE